MRSKQSTLLGMLTGLVGLTCPVATASAVEIFNESSFQIIVSVQDNGLPERTLNSGESTVFNLTAGSPTDERIVDVRTTGTVSDPFNWEVHVRAQRDGQVRVRQVDRPLSWGGIPNPYAEGYAVGGQLVDTEPNMADMRFRSIRFAASSDCQFCPPCDTAPDLAEEEKVIIPTLTNRLMCSMVQDTEVFRGALLAGDLTQYSGVGHLQAYKDSIEGHEHNVYDGLGNHDVDGVSDRVIDFVRDRRRSTLRMGYSDPLPHYSWDWHDVHFVQLNVFPGDLPNPAEPLIHPRWALQFLNADLQTHVGDSGRPVVLVSHYGFESFSLGAWTDDQREQFYDIIDGYNVVLMLTGHRHYGETTPATTRSITIDYDGSGGNDEITTFNVGASRYGAWTEVGINSAGQISFEVYNEYGTRQSREVVTFRSPIHVDAANPDEGYGWKENPFSRIELGLIAKFYPEPFGASIRHDKVPLLIAPGNYDEQITIQESVVLTPDSPGSVVIGRP